VVVAVDEIVVRIIEIIGKNDMHEKRTLHLSARSSTSNQPRRI
jgi:hypothetical protein